MNDEHGSPRKPAKQSARLALLRIAFLPVTLAAFGCANIVVEGGAGGGGGAGTSGVSASTGIASGPGPIDVEDGTSEANPPLGVWSMIVQYGPPGEAVSPTRPMQVEMRADGSAFAWICAGAPDDGSFSQSCTPVARSQCWLGTFAWTGVRWRVDFPVAHVGGVPEQGDVTPDGNGNILISYINPTYSGALFKKVGEATTGADACVP